MVSGAANGQNSTSAASNPRSGKALRKRPLSAASRARLSSGSCPTCACVRDELAVDDVGQAPFEAEDRFHVGWSVMTPKAAPTIAEKSPRQFQTA
jgi:hypothetical protein